jgi:hypothetical protein
MNLELLSALATEHRRDLPAGPHAGRAHVPPQAHVRSRAAGRPHRALRVPRPSLRVSWSRTTLAAAAGRRRGRSVVIVISATRLL